MSTRMRYLPQTVAESKAFRVLPGVRETLDRLHAEGYLLGVTTGGMEAAAHIKLARANLDHYFSFGGFGSDSGDRIELTRRALERASALLGEPLDPRQVLVVGDTPHDVEAAHGAGALAVGVATGHFDADALRDAGADYVLGSLEEQLPLATPRGGAVTDPLVLDDPAGEAAERLAAAASAGGQIALTGGSTARPAYERLAPAEVDWSRCTLWFGDERCVPPADEDSNFGMFRESLLDRLPGEAPDVRRIPGELGPDAGAAAYEHELRAAFGEASPSIRPVLLGLGPDGHCASLFPGDPALEERERLAVGVARSGLAPWVPRVTLTLPVSTPPARCCSSSRARTRPRRSRERSRAGPIPVPPPASSRPPTAR